METTSIARGTQPSTEPRAIVRRRWLLAAAASSLGVALAVTASARGWTSAEGDFGWRRPLSVPAGSAVAHALLGIRSTITIDGDVGGDAVALFCDVIVRGRVAGDALAVFGRVVVEGSDATVEGDAVALFGVVERRDGGRVGGEARSLWPLPERGGWIAWTFSPPLLALRLVVLSAWMLAALAAAFAAPERVVRAAGEIRRHPVRLIGIGLLVLASLATTLMLCVALVVVVIGVPLLFVLALVAAVLGALAHASCFHAVGERILERLVDRPTAGNAKVLVGALLFAVLAFVPIAGELAWLLAYLAGAGAVAATRTRALLPMPPRP